MAKSSLSAVVGVAVEKVEIESIEDPLTKYVPAIKNSAYDGISIRNGIKKRDFISMNVYGNYD